MSTNINPPSLENPHPLTCDKIVLSENKRYPRKRRYCELVTCEPSFSFMPFSSNKICFSKIAITPTEYNLTLFLPGLDIQKI